MSEQNAERLIRAMYDRWNAEGTDAMAERFFDAEVEYHDARWPGGGARHGRRAVIARFDGRIAGENLAFSRVCYDAAVALEDAGMSE